jgi:hypothetical protein
VGEKRHEAVVLYDGVSARGLGLLEKRLAGDAWRSAGMVKKE